MLHPGRGTRLCCWTKKHVSMVHTRDLSLASRPDMFLAITFSAQRLPAHVMLLFSFKSAPDKTKQGIEEPGRPHLSNDWGCGWTNGTYQTKPPTSMNRCNMFLSWSGCAITWVTQPVYHFTIKGNLVSVGSLRRSRGRDVVAPASPVYSNLTTVPP